MYVIYFTFTNSQEYTKQRFYKFTKVNTRVDINMYSYLYKIPLQVVYSRKGRLFYMIIAH